MPDSRPPRSDHSPHGAPSSRGSAPFDLTSIAAGLPGATLIDQMANSPVGTFPRLVVEAPPGTGKTTLVPPLVADHLARHAVSSTGASGGLGRVIVTQPRRMAARAAARRLATLTGTRLGEDIGFSVRGESRTSARTRIEFVTTGVLLNRLLRDPELAGVSAVILDEVHERHLDTDLSFAMCRELADLRDDLGLVVMSATLDATMWAKRLGSGEVTADSAGGGEAPAVVVSAAAEAHPLEVRWAPPKHRPLDARGVTRDFLDHVARTCVDALSDHDSGDVLVFAPGAREVEEIASRIGLSLPAGADTEVVTLLGRTPAREQDAILRPHSAEVGRRRVIVSTSVAESALTVPGVRIVVDSGLARGPRLDTRRGMSGLVTTRESKASGVQRAGRAARLGPGVVHRCLSESEWAALPEQTPPEIATSDLTSAVLSLAVWGGDPDLLPEPMPAGPRRVAVENLLALGAIEDEPIRVTELGRSIARIPASVWSARGLFDGAALLSPNAAAEAVAVIESEQRSPGADLVATLRELRRSKDRRFVQDVKRFADLASESADADGVRSPPTAANPRASPNPTTTLTPEDLGLVVALAHPLQIGRLRSSSSTEYLLASGTAASLPRNSSLQGSRWLAISEVGLVGGRAVIRAAVAIDQDTAELAGAGLMATEETASFDRGKVRAVRRTRLGGIELSATPIKTSPELARSAIARSVRERGAREVLRPSEAFEGLRSRLGLLHAVYGSPWPDVTWSQLSATLTDWCPAALDRIARGSDPGRVDLVSALRTLLPWPQAARLDELVPVSIEVPSGSRIRLDYPDPDHLDGEDERAEAGHEPQSPHGLQGPVLAVKLQECFGWRDVPYVCEGRIPVVVHLLSPARRPLAVTSDLASFWANAYLHVRAENRGRYPKHPWPEDPLTAPPMRGTKRSGTMKR
ncbi:ATP-dependent helicase HrpB [Brevibacterium marinum]|uniref:ATP-dependent helicase HrpB n=1 Tax=Brevibacterium marinum TaxID=418643 RepID=A0A846RY13_9MICO|nr:ATP-dependent helicase HrpB [Brevibacterium marinum]NJC56836.1 ATP-dependent helicase HrpB [Brevibacterium marinum]